MAVLALTEKRGKKMERRDFLKKTSQAGLASGCLFMTNGSNLFAQTKETELKDKEQIFKENWIKSLMENMEKQHDKKARIKLMESCGRSCARRSNFIKTAQSCKGNVKKLVETFAKYLSEENKYIKEDGSMLKRVGNRNVIYQR